MLCFLILFPVLPLMKIFASARFIFKVKFYENKFGKHRKYVNQYVQTRDCCRWIKSRGQELPTQILFSRKSKKSFFLWHLEEEYKTMKKVMSKLFSMFFTHIWFFHFPTRTTFHLKRYLCSIFAYMVSQTQYWSAIGQALSDNKTLGFSLHLSVFPIQLAKSALILLSFLHDRVMQSK